MRMDLSWPMDRAEKPSAMLARALCLVKNGNTVCLGAFRQEVQGECR